MSGKSKGSVSLLLLLTCLLLAATAHLGLLWSSRQFAKTQEALAARQMRRLNSSLMQKYFYERPQAGKWVALDSVLQPGGVDVQIQGSSSYSSDNLIHLLQFKAASGKYADVAQQISRLQLTFSEAQRNLAAKYALASVKTKGLEYLPQQSLYIQASREEVRLPQMYFLYNKALNGLSIDNTDMDGLHARFYYLNSSDAITFKANTLMLGSSVVGKSGAIIIGENCHFPHRVALISENGSITIKKNTRLDKALIMAYSRVIIEPGCKINGFIAANEIQFLGVSEFTADAYVVAPFTSAAFVES